MTLNRLGSTVEHDMAMAREPQSVGPRRRTFSPAEKLALLAGYETAMETGRVTVSCGSTACTRR